jgi:hypothetical protein
LNQEFIFFIFFFVFIFFIFFIFFFSGILVSMLLLNNNKHFKFLSYSFFVQSLDSIDTRRQQKWSLLAQSGKKFIDLIFQKIWKKYKNRYNKIQTIEIR